MTNIVKTLVYISTCILLCLSCDSDSTKAKSLDVSSSYGDWQLSEAVRDGKLTKTLEGAMFSIDSNLLSTNIFGDDQSFGYQLIGKKMKLSGAETQVFTVDKSSSDTLILGMKRNKKKYQLLLVRSDTSIVK